VRHRLRQAAGGFREGGRARARLLRGGRSGDEVARHLLPTEHFLQRIRWGLGHRVRNVLHRGEAEVEAHEAANDINRRERVRDRLKQNLNGNSGR